MVQIVENWADVEGVVARVFERDDAPGLELDVGVAHPVAEYPNLLADDVGRRIAIILTGGATDPPPAPGTRVRCRVRKAGLNRYYARSVTPLTG
jgi:hypothetical protein